MTLKLLNLMTNLVNFANEISNQQYWSQRMNETYQPKRPSQLLPGTSPNKSHNDSTQLVKINNELQKIAHRDQDVKSSIQNLKIKLNIHFPPEVFNDSFSSISMSDLCINCNTLKAKLQTLINHSTPLREEIKIIALENSKLARQNKKLQTKIRELQDEVNHKLIQRQIDLDKESKLLVDFKMKDLECTALLKQSKSLTTNIEKLKNQVTELNRQMQSVGSLKQNIKDRQKTQIQKTFEMYVSMLKQKDEQFISEKRRFEQHMANKQMQYNKIQESHMQLKDELNKQIQQKQGVIELLNRSVKTQFQSQANIFNEKSKLKQSQFENLKTMFQNLKAELITVKNDNVYMKQMIANYEIQLQQQTQRIQEYETKLSQPSSKENISIRRQFEQLKTQVQQSQRIEDDYLDKIEQLESFYKNQLNINQGLTRNFKAVQEEKKRVLFEKTHLKEQLDRAIAKVKNIEYEKEMIERQLQKSLKKIKELTKNMEQTLEENKRMQQKIYFYENSSNKIETEYRSALANYQKKVQESNKKISQLKDTLKRTQNEKIEKVQSLQRQFLNIQTQLNQQKIEKKIELQYHARLNGELIVMRDLLNKETEECKQISIQFQQAQKRMQLSQQQNLSLSQSLSKQKQQGKQLTRDLNSQKNESQRLQKQNIVFEHQRQVYQSEIQMLKSSLKASSQTKIKQLEQYSKFEALSQQIIGLKDKCLQQESHQDTLKCELRTKVKGLYQANIKIEQLNKNVIELQNKLQCRQNQLNQIGTKISQEQLQFDSKIFELEINKQELEEEIKKQHLLSAQALDNLQTQLQQSLIRQTSFKENVNQLMEILQEKESMISEEKLRHIHYVEEKERELEILKHQSQEKYVLLQTQQSQELLKLNHELMKMIENTSTLQDQLNILSNDNQYLLEDNRKLLNQNNTFKKQLDLLNKQMQISLKEKSKEHQAREQEKHKELKLELEHAYQEIVHLEGSLMGQRNQISKLNSANIQILNQNRALFDERRILINEKAQLQKEAQNLIEKLQQVTQQVQNSDQRLNQVQYSCKLRQQELDNKESSLMKLMSQLKQKQQNFYQIENKIQNQLQQNQKLQIQLQTKIREIEQKTTQLQQRNIQLQQRNIQLQQKNDQIKLKADLLNQRETKSKENQLSLEDTLLNAKKMLELIEKKSLIIQKIKLKKKQKESHNLSIKTKETTLQNSKPLELSENSIARKALIKINLNDNSAQSNSVESDNEEQNHQSPVQIQNQAQETLQGDMKSLQNKITAFLKQNKKQRQIKINQNKNSKLNFSRQNTKENQEIIELIAHIQEPKQISSGNDNQCMHNKSLFFAEIQTFILIKHGELKDKLGQQFKQIPLLILEILQANRMITSTKTEENLKRLAQDIKDIIEKIFDRLICGANKGDFFQKKIQVQQTPIKQTKESQSKLLRNESMQFKKNKLHVSSSKIKQAYVQIYSDRKVPQKFELIEEYPKSQSLSLQTEEFFFEESIKDLPKKKQKSILLVEDIGEAISVDEGQNQEQIYGSTMKYSLNASIESISLKQIQKQMNPSRQFKRSFQSQPEQILHSSYPKKNSIDQQSQAPELMLSQQSSMSRKQIEDRYKTSVKNAKLSQKLKSKKRS